MVLQEFDNSTQPIQSESPKTDEFLTFLENVGGTSIPTEKYISYRIAFVDYLYQLYLLDKEQRDEARNNGN